MPCSHNNLFCSNARYSLYHRSAAPKSFQPNLPSILPFALPISSGEIASQLNQVPAQYQPANRPSQHQKRTQNQPAKSNGTNCINQLFYSLNHTLIITRLRRNSNTFIHFFYPPLCVDFTPPHPTFREVSVSLLDVIV